MSRSYKLPFLYVVVPTYNAGENLQKTLTSIAMQDLSSAKLIILDDASSDGSIKIAEDFLKKESFQWEIKRGTANVGVAKNIDRYFNENQDVLKSWIMLLGHDDVLSKDYVKSFRKTQSIYGDKYVYYGNLRIIDSLDKVMGKIKPSLSPSRSKKLNTIILSYTNMIPSPGTFFHGSYLSKSSTNLDNDCTHDWNIWLWLSTQCGFKKMPGAEVFYRLNEGSLSARCSIRSIHEQHLQDFKHFAKSKEFIDYSANLNIIEKKHLLMVSTLLRRRFSCKNSALIDIVVRKTFLNFETPDLYDSKMCRCNNSLNQRKLSKKVPKCNRLDGLMARFATIKFWCGCLISFVKLRDALN